MGEKRFNIYAAKFADEWAREYADFRPSYPDELFSWLADNVRNVKVTRQNEIAQAFKSLGGKLIKGCKVKGLGSSVNVWCIRNHEKYKNMTAKELGEKYKTFYTDSKNNTLFPPVNKNPKQSK